MASAQTVPQAANTMSGSGRVLSLDVLRGLTIALMILVNDPGDWGHVFRQLDHSEWNGWTLTDLVFPTFLFLMGASMVFSLAARRARGDCNRTLTGHLFARAGKILALGLFLAFFPFHHWSTIRYFGVLPRIALCYLCAGLLLLALPNARGVSVAIGVLLVGYWVLLRWVPVPGAGMPVRDIPLLDPAANLTSWMDRGVVNWTQHWLHTGRLYKGVRDPEGVLSALPAVASTLLGSLAGMWMRSTRGCGMRGPLLAAGLASFVAGEAWSFWFPINKNLWTSSYVLMAAGFAALALAACSSLVDNRSEPWPRWLRAVTWPWLVFGSNAIAAYTLSQVIVQAATWIKFADSDGDKNSLWALTYENVFARQASTNWTSLWFAVSYVGLCFLPIWWLWRKKIFIRV
jgi:predicted acyltransferase